MTVRVKKDRVSVDFIEILTEKIKDYLSETLRSYDEKIKLWQKYINDNIKMFSYSLKSIDLKALLRVGIENITYKETPSEYIIGIDDEKKLSDMYVSIYDVCKLINFGNLRMNGTRLFSDVFDSIQNNLSKIEDLYYSGEPI